MATLHRYNGSAWVEVPSGTAFKYYNGSAWVNPNTVKYWDGDSWETAWNKSNSVELVFEAVDSNSWRTSGWRGSSDLRFGSFGFGDHIGVMSFVTGNNTNSATAADGTSVSANTLANHLAERPYVTAASLTLYRTTGGYNPINASGFPNSENWYIGYYDGTIGSGTASSDINLTNMTTISAATLNALVWNHNESKTLTNLDTTMAAQLGSKELWGSNRYENFSGSGGQDTSYSTFDGHSDTNKPTLTVTLDYVAS
tara:strand:+ start:7176 stop:7940 length:765 start_codon:yes stop_codon:yes gene_type:complete